jgi:aminoglycoside 2''-phosphotransferase
MSTDPWEADRPLTLETARALVGARFPQVDAASLVQIGSGWEFDVFRTADGWAFRFPRRAQWANLFDQEARVHRLVAPWLTEHVALPTLELVGEPGPEFPYRFAAHRFIEGVPADSVDPALLTALAHDIGAFLGAIHAIPEQAARAAGIVEHDASNTAANPWVRRCTESLASRRGSDPLIDRAADWLAEAIPLIRRFTGPLRFIHHDLAPGHLVVDPRTGRLKGVLDWTSSILGDGARDFVFLVAWQGWPFVEQVLSSYPIAVDGAFRDRLRRSARFLTSLWLGEAHAKGRDLTRAERSVRNAFELPDAAEQESITR